MQKSLFNYRPEALILQSFLLAALLGAILLKLPISSTETPLSWINALFMATSAVCVTGLSVVDLGKDLTLFGQAIILFLIQLGGLGIMTFSMLFLIFIGKRISLYSQLCVPDLSQDMGSKNVRYSVFLIFVMTFVIESVGAVLLFLNLKNYHSISFAAYSSIFHSISAFCNSGFSIYSDSLMRFNNNPNILLIMMTLIVLGGLGFIVIYDIVTIIRNKKRHNEKIFINLHTKIALAGSLFFIIFGAISIWLLENRGLMRDMPVAYQFFNSFFLSVTSRTAGFNTVDISLLSSPTLLLLISLMFIGGCPGSTAGGIKIHTFLSVFALIRNKMKGLEMASLFGRKIPNDTVDRALTIFISSLLIIFVAVFLLQLIENKLVPHLQVKLREGFLDFLFESVSAFGTVGLSTGATSYLSFWGKAITIFLMLIGRIGPLTLGIALQTRQKSKIVYEFPNEEIIVS